jgi:hypothetical protein
VNTPRALSDATLLFLRQQLGRYTRRVKFEIYRDELEGLLAEVEKARREHRERSGYLPENQSAEWDAYEAILQGEVPSG